jgi:uncharacterized protein (TIGR01777 family)
MKIVLAGGTGLIGKNLIKRLVEEGHMVNVLSRTRPETGAETHGQIQYIQWDGENVGEWIEKLNGAEVVINLAGEPIAGKRWSTGQKEKILSSRIAPTRTLVKAIEQINPQPGLLINASAVGYYGNVDEGEVTESHTPGKGFLADTCLRWEREAAKASDLGVRVVSLRISLVLSQEGGALPRLMMPYRFFAGGYLGSGRQWMPWIHIDDLIGIMMFVIANPELNGPLNAVSPEPITMKEFAKVLGKVTGKPAWLPVPSIALKLILGEMAGMLLEGQKAVPRKLLENGFSFKFERLEEALSDLLKNKIKT